MLQYDVRVVEDDLGEVTHIGDDALGNLTVIAQDVTMEIPEIGGPKGRFGDTAVALFEPGQSIELCESNFKPLLKLNGALKDFPVPEGREGCEVVTRVVGLGPSGEIGYHRMLVDWEDHFTMYDDGFYIYNPGDNTTLEIPDGFELLGLTAAGDPIIPAEDGSISVIRWNLKGKRWDELDCFFEGGRANFLGGDPSNHHVIAPFEGIRVDEFGLPRIFSRNGTERPIQLENCLVSLGVADEVTYGLGARRANGSYSISAQYWVDGQAANLFGNEIAQIEPSVPVIADGSIRWRAGKQFEFVGNERGVAFDGSNFALLDYLGPMLWTVTENDAQEGRSRKGISLANVVPGIEVFEVKQIAKGIILAETEHESALLIPKKAPAF